MTEITLNQLKINEGAQPEYPLLRARAACQEWGSQQALQMAQQGCASVLLLWRTGLLDLEPALRDKCEKVYGALLAARGPLRGQPGLRARLIDMLDASPDMWMHGGRLYVAMVNGTACRSSLWTPTCRTSLNCATTVSWA